MQQGTTYDVTPTSSSFILKLEGFLAGQGSTTRKIAAQLRKSGWDVIYVCIPNTPHIGVVPIPTKSGVTAQRYPDILSIQGNVLRLSEIEIAVTDDIASKAIERFTDQRCSILSPEIYLPWRDRVLELTGHQLPVVPGEVICELISCTRFGKNIPDLAKTLAEHCINVVCSGNYECTIKLTTLHSLQQTDSAEASMGHLTKL